MIIKSLLDNDLYKLTMQMAVLELFPSAQVSYKFKNRGKQRFNQNFLQELKKEINNMQSLSLSQIEYLWLKEKIPFLKPWFLEYLANYRFNPNEINVNLDESNDLKLTIEGSWHSTILWEVPLMAIISELYFKIIDTEWNKSKNSIINKASAQLNQMTFADCYFADFGTRRRRSFDTHNVIIDLFSNWKSPYNNKSKNTCVGTSNVYLAMQHNMKPIGTFAHEFVQGMQSLESLNHCNYFAMQNWIRVYNANLGIALTDTIGLDMFLKNFNKRFSMMFAGVRHDSGCPYEFTDKMIAHYEKMGIDPKSKTIIFSDGLDIDKVINIKTYCQDKINCSFGIGTKITNNFKDSPALNMVIKLWDVNGLPVVKLPDTEGKANGDMEAVKNMKWIVKNQLGNKI